MSIITSQAPTRLGLFGGSTDLEPFASKYGGVCISMAINIRQHFTLYTDDDMWTVGIENKVPYGCKLDFVYAFREVFGVNSMHHNKFVSTSDGGIESGIGSSASSAVAIVAALAKSQELEMGTFEISKREIAKKAWEIETKKLGLFGGVQDQITAAFGGFLLIYPNEKYWDWQIDKVLGDRLNPLISSIVLFHTNTTRQSAVIQEGLKDLTEDRLAALLNIKDNALKALDIIKTDMDLEKLGNLLDESWQFKKQSNKVSNPTIDKYYDLGKKYGAWGGKCCGAGQGGFMFFMIDPTKKPKFIEKMQKEGLEWWDFSVCQNGVETRILP